MKKIASFLALPTKTLLNSSGLLNGATSYKTDFMTILRALRHPKICARFEASSSTADLTSTGPATSPGKEFDEIPTYEVDWRHCVTQFLK